MGAMQNQVQGPLLGSGFKALGLRTSVLWALGN